MVFWFTGENTGERLNSVVAPECSCYHLEQLKQPTHLYIIIYINLQWSATMQTSNQQLTMMLQIYRKCCILLVLNRARSSALAYVQWI